MISGNCVPPTSDSARDFAVPAKQNSRTREIQCLRLYAPSTFQYATVNMGNARDVGKAFRRKPQKPKHRYSTVKVEAELLAVAGRVCWLPA